MKKLAILPLCLGCVFTVSTSHAIDLKQSKLTQVVNDVQIISADSQQQKTASINDIFSMPDILRTGPASRAELIAADETVTRVGANTIFSFDPASRTINLKQGSLLFHSPHGKGGGTIHTGSATASVLGTTLIVTTTPTGGMKVLDLEGSVEVKFLNGLKQNLAPGHMTFVLPGGNQLAPIIVFRLDDLTKNSKLVGGFNGSLASMPLIQQQIDKQLKAIKNGDLTDTGLNVGGDATHDTVQVLDLNTLQSALDGSFYISDALKAAFASDAHINQSSLPSDRVFSDSLGIDNPDSPFLIPGNTFFAGQPFQGFAARNIYFNDIIHASPLAVDLSPYADRGEFDFVAKDTLSINGDVDFNGLSESESIIFTLVGGKQILVTPGVTINADVANFEWQTPSGLTLDSVRIQNGVGNTAFGLGGNFTMQNGSYLITKASFSVLTPKNIAINHSTVGADSMQLQSVQKNVSIDSSVLTFNTFSVITAEKSITLNNSTFNANGTSGQVAFNTHSGAVNITGSSIQANYLSVNSGDGILLDGTGQSFNAYGDNSQANFTTGSGNSGGLASFNNTDLTQFKSVNVTANTINLSGVAFGNVPVSLKSLFGQWHNGTSAFGYVNNLGGNTYNGQAISAANGAHGLIAGTVNTGLTVSAR